MATRKPKPTVELSHPSGRFTVHVQPARAAILEERGYTPVAPKATPRAATKASKAATPEQDD